MKGLNIYWDGELVGKLYQREDGLLKFQYDNCGINDPEELKELANNLEYLEKMLSVDFPVRGNGRGCERESPKPRIRERSSKHRMPPDSPLRSTRLQAMMYLLEPRCTRSPAMHCFWISAFRRNKI